MLSSVIRPHNIGDLPSQAALRLLIVEDDFLTADYLFNELEDIGARPLPPAPTIEQAVGRLAQCAVDAAILDINLKGDRVFPLADLLADMQMPFVFYTGYDDIAVPSRFRNVPARLKPATASDLLKALPVRSLRPSQSDVSEQKRREVVYAIPQLRAIAFLMTRDRSAADKLVEAVLEYAIEHVHEYPRDAPLEEWLKALLQDCAVRKGFRTLH